MVVEPTHLKTIPVKDGFPKFAGENEKCLKPPTSMVYLPTFTIKIFPKTVGGPSLVKGFTSFSKRIAEAQSLLPSMKGPSLI